jgi:predicted metal-dependent enzyme (double-stranded beta helix superfamily)
MHSGSGESPLIIDPLEAEPSEPAVRYCPQSLVSQVELCLNEKDMQETVLNVRRVPLHAIQRRQGFLPEVICQPSSEHYVRRPLHIDPLGRFSIFVMTWSENQSTLLHDHGGLWVVEALYRGRVKVTDFEYLGETNGIHKFAETETNIAGPGQSSYRVPPDEHHVLGNAQAAASVSIHVFGGLLEECHTYIPVEGGYLQAPMKMEPTLS